MFYTNCLFTQSAFIALLAVLVGCNVCLATLSSALPVLVACWAVGHRFRQTAQLVTTLAMKTSLVVDNAQRATLSRWMLAVGNDALHTVRTQGANPVIQRHVVIKADPRPKMGLAQWDRVVVDPLGMAAASVYHAGEEDFALEAVAFVVQFASTLAAVHPLVPVGSTEDMRCVHIAPIHTTEVEFALVFFAL